MAKIYSAQIANYEFTLKRDPRLEINFWGPSLVQKQDFEDAAHLLMAEDEEYVLTESNKCADICEVEPAIWAISEDASDLSNALIASGCRLARDVTVKKGTKKYKLLYVAPVLDLLDIESSDIVWNSDQISWVRNPCFSKPESPVPLAFQVRFNNRNGAKYRGSDYGLSGKVYVSEEFKTLYEKGRFSGLEFVKIPIAE